MTHLLALFILSSLIYLGKAQSNCVWQKTVQHVDIFFYSSVRVAKVQLSNKQDILGPQSDCGAACLAYSKFKCTAFVWARKEGGTDGDCYVYGEIAPTTAVYVKESSLESIHDLWDYVCDGIIPSHRICKFELTHAGIVSDTAGLSTSVGQSPVTDLMSASVQDCQERCVLTANMPVSNKVCTAFSIKVGSFSTCYTYSNIVTSAIDTSGNDPLYQMQCIVDCVYSAWTAWSTCTSSCSGGTQTRTRTVVTQASNGGLACNSGFLSQSQTCNTAGCKVDCVWGTWSVWGSCSISCGGGTQTRSRSVSVQAANGGAVCTGSATETQPCGAVGCPINCAWGVWSDWGACSISCGGGTHMRKRTVSVQAQNGGASCSGFATETQPCGAVGCPINCAWGNWADWGSCTVSCGSGTHIRTRTVSVQAQNGGTGCTGSASESQICGTVGCPRDCTLSSWGAWASCSATCGSGSWTRTRTVVTSASNGGTCSGALIETTSCNVGSCPVNCVLSGWGAWGSCSVTCGSGSWTRTRTVIQAAANGGTACAALSITGTCTPRGCPSDCVVSAWGTWGICSKVCGSGTQSRGRSITTAATNGGTCVALSESQNCNTHACPVDCVLSGWTAWGTCSVTCGSGTWTKTRTVIRASANNGKACAALSMSGTCMPGGCPVNCIVNNWGVWGACSKTCGGGSQVRARTIKTASANGGTCAHALSATQACNTQGCPQDCVLSGWTAWGTCSVTCGSGSWTKTRTVIRAAANNGKACAALSMTGTCTPRGCPVNCIVNNWGPWGACSKTCGGGTQVRGRSIKTAAANGGTCAHSLTASQACNTQGCPQDCVMSGWGAWGSCSVTCGSGTYTRTRTVIKAAANNGKACAALSMSGTCSAGGCPVNCVVSNWQTWGVCSRTCGGGSQTRARSIVKASANGGTVCPTLTATQGCNTNGCPQNCVLSGWTAWGTCSATCGSGTWKKTRTIIRAPANSGKSCDALSMSTSCKIRECPVNCIVNSWAAWGACSKSCGGGTHSRSRSLKTAAAHGGTCSHSLTASQACNTHNCPIDCVFSGWSTFGACTVTCDGGTKKRTRTIIKQAAHGGKQCVGSTTETQVCNTNGCAQNCIVSNWAAWGACTKTCGTGTQQRLRSITRQALNGGTCVALSASQNCNTNACPIHCTVTAWSGWSSCSKSCDGGSQTRVRFYLQEASNGGTCTYHLSENNACNTQGCAINCVVSNWAAWGACSKTCGAGVQKRIRTITKQALNGGSCNQALATNQTCTVKACPVDCTLTAWSGWSTCSISCGVGGSQTRVRFVTSPASADGSCPSLKEQQTCQLGGCPVDCVWSVWSGWSTCKGRCDLGTKKRERVIVTNGVDGGKACTNADQYQSASCQTGIACWSWVMIAAHSLNVTHRCSSKGYAVIANSQNCSADCAAHTAFPCKAYAWDGVKGSTCYLHGEIDRYISLTNLTKSYYYLYQHQEYGKSYTHDYFWTLYVGIDESQSLSTLGYATVANTLDCGQACLDHKAFVCRAYVWMGPGSVCHLHGEINKGIYLRDNSLWVLYKRDTHAVAPIYTSIYKVYKSVDPRAWLGLEQFAVIHKSPDCHQECMSHQGAFICAAYVWSEKTNKNCYLLGPSALSTQKPVLQHGSPFDLFVLVNRNTVADPGKSCFKLTHSNVVRESITARKTVNVTRMVDLPQCELLCKMGFVGRDFSCAAFAFNPTLATTLKQSQRFEHSKYPNCFLFDTLKSTGNNVNTAPWNLYQLQDC